MATCRHYKSAAFWTKDGDCELCIQEELKMLREEVRTLHRELTVARIRLGERQDID